jgi:hypothetical protein
MIIDQITLKTAVRQSKERQLYAMLAKAVRNTG